MLGTIFWTVGLFASVTFVLIHVMHVYPGIISSIHIAFGNLAFILVLAIGCMVAGMWQVRRGLSTVDELRTRLSSVHRGEADRVTGSYPNEVQPLVDDLNALLDHRKDLVQRAIAKAGDLAHRLKTPLAVLSQEAQRAKRDGHRELAASLGSQVERMRTQIDYHLAHARAAASGATPGTHCHVLPSTDALSRTLKQLYTERGITIEVPVAPECAVRCQREDLEEMLGNLLDNACKWARARIIVRSCDTGAGFTLITVEDDGPGLAPAMRESVLQRGVRADEAVPGSGLGLAIVRDLAELYGGSIELAESPTGGLAARLRLPSLANNSR
ncbi:MAG TPA: ATP-binding protein [Vicinamibacterales bacterium]|jgi:signal transduction histidine kinase